VKINDGEDEGRHGRDRRGKGPKEMHEHWEGGTYHRWLIWKEDFEDLVEEFKYDNDKALRRLMRYTSRSPDTGLVRECRRSGLDWLEMIEKLSSIKIQGRKGGKKKSLRDVRQGKWSVERFFQAFSTNATELEVVKGRNFGDAEKIEAFIEGLNTDVRRAVAMIEIDELTFLKFAERVLRLDASLKQAEPERNESSRSLMTRGVCYEFVNKGKCSRGGCKFDHDADRVCKDGAKRKEHKM